MAIPTRISQIFSYHLPVWFAQKPLALAIVYVLIIGWLPNRE